MLQTDTNFMKFNNKKNKKKESIKTSNIFQNSETK
jgi:hypothetical protein